MTKLALLLGEGALALAALQAAQMQFGMDHVVPFRLSDAMQELPLFDLDNLPKAIETTKAFQPTHICVAGRVELPPHRRQAMARSMAFSGNNASTDLGLEHLFGAVAQSIGALPVGVHEIAPTLLAGQGNLFGPASQMVIGQQRQLIEATRQFGTTDLGQAMIFAGGQPVAGEDIGGTDSLLKRVANLSDQFGLAGDLCLVKTKKPQQSGVGDLPTIGRKTIELAAAAGIATIIIEAGHTLVLDQDELPALCEKLGVSIIGST